MAIVGGGDNGFNLSAPADGNIYLIDGGDAFALVDAGMGSVLSDTELILENIRNAGIDPSAIDTLLLTHYHGDHAGGAADIRDALGCEVHASVLCADVMNRGDTELNAVAYAKSIGGLPPEYEFRACPCTGDLVDGHAFKVGRLTVTVFETPGHCAGHLSFLVEGGDRRYLIGGDLVFHGGKIVNQYIWDNSIQDYGKSMMRMADVEFDALLPGHWTISLRDGSRHVKKAAETFRTIGMPPNGI
jgi:glyoxylase-like metal-dependent hydrolase (beta-lactamase superfamily II)